MDNKYRAVITGIGMITANGNNREEVYANIMNGKTGLAENEEFKKLKLSSCMVGTVKMDIPELDKYAKEEKLEKMAKMAIDEALIDAGLTRNDITSVGRRAGMTFSTSNAGGLRIDKYVKDKVSSRETIPCMLCDNSFMLRISQYAGVRGPCYVTMSACAAGTAGAGIALDMIRDEKVDIAIIGGSDNILNVSVCGFNSLQSMSIDNCKPFDKNRNGMSIGEGTAIMIVETLERAKKRGAHIYGEILGYGLANDGYHITSPDPNGEAACYAMKMAIREAGVQENEIKYINAHGTGTKINDKMELKAINELFKNSSNSVAISSTKSMTGHCLGTAGSIELAITIMAVSRNMAPPTSTLKEPECEYEKFNLIKEKGQKCFMPYAMSNSFAFAGNAASIIIGKVDYKSNKQ